MKIAKPTKALVTVALGLVVAALIWPSTVDRWFPGWNPKAQAVRSHLPSSIAGMLPDQPKPSASAQTAAGGAPNAAGGRGSAGGANRPPASVRVATAQRGPQAVRAESVGTVQPIASVAIRSRVDAQIESIQVSDGAAVKAGDVLVKLDSRQIEAQIKQAEAALARNQALLEQAERDVRRFAELVSKQTGTQVNLDNARTSVASSKAAILGDEAQIENLKVQLGWYTIRAPIPGRVGTFSQKAGNIIRSGDGTATGTLTTIVQTTPIYVAFSLPQRYLSDLRNAMSAQDSEVLATPQGATSPMKGRIAVIDNAIDSATGTLTVRAVFDNPDEILWSGQLCSVRVVLRTEPDAVSVPREAILIGQSGNYVYVIENGVARVRPVTIGRSQDGRDIIQTGLKGGESVVIDGSLNLQNGSRVEVRSVEARKVAD
ncbi:MAG: efflux RND transporter periplasmic adaptor subunit [Beijerinckiaceae bacterium]|nr:efflux RND transporter periplasmic adaptor subunit [Beijerinckiaceae bacterium]